MDKLSQSNNWVWNFSTTILEILLTFVLILKYQLTNQTCMTYWLNAMPLGLLIYFYGKDSLILQTWANCFIGARYWWYVPSYSPLGTLSSHKRSRYSVRSFITYRLVLVCTDCHCGSNYPLYTAHVWTSD